MKKNFTKKILLLILLMVNVGLLSAQQLVTDNFNYSGALTANGWVAHSAGGTTPIVTTTGLTYSGLATSGIGNAALVGNAGGEDINLAFASQNTIGQSIYLSCMVNITDAAATKAGDYFLHLGATAGASLTNFGARIGVRITASGVNFGISNGAITYGTTNFTKNTTYLLIAKYTIATGNDPVSLWIVPSGVPATEAAAGTPESTIATTAGQDAITSVALRQGNNGSSVQTVVDGILVGLTWADVVPTVAAGPTLAATGNATGLSTTQGTASASGSFNLSGSSLTGFPGTITATASSTDFEISNDNATWGPTTTIAYTAATLAATPVYVRLSATAPLGAVSGTVSLAGGGATTINANVGGNVLVAQPTVQASNILVSDITDNGFTINWTNGNGAARLVAVRATTTTGVVPVDGSVYTTTLGGGNTIWYNGTANAATPVTGLIPGTSYTVQAYEFNGSTAGSTNYLTTTNATNPVTVSTTGISPNIQQGFFTAVAAPQFGARSAIRVPTVAIGTISGLAPNTTYRYFSTGAAATDFGTSNSAGTLILNDYTVPTPSFFTASTGSLTTAGSYGKFTSDASGKFTGTFGYFASSNSRFDSAAQVYITVTLGEDVTPFSVKYRFALNQFITILDWGTASAEGSFIKGASLASANNVVGLWNSIDGNLVAARPLAMTLVEDNATTTAPTAPYDENPGSWNTIIPNDNPEGVRLIQQFTPAGVVVGCNSDADGAWPSGALTSDPTNGSVAANAIQITAVDAPINAGSCFAVLPVSLVNFTATKANRTVSLKWTTAQELNSRSFVIERSSDNRTWNTIATVAAAGFSNVAKNYVYIDNSPAKGINYYRLKQVDADYRSVNSAVKSVLFSEQYAISVSPNPTTDFINVYIAKNDQKTTQVIVADINGKVIEKRTTGDQLLQISTSRFAKGVYFVKVITDEQTTTQKVIVQ